MDDRPVLWDKWNREHIEKDHPERNLRRHEVNEALHDPRRHEVIEMRDGTTYHDVVGQTKGGRVLFVVWVDHPMGRYPIHARQAGRRLSRRYYK
jgi:uncharacterized DUF497 family protein